MKLRREKQVPKTNIVELKLLKENNIITGRTFKIFPAINPDPDSEQIKIRWDSYWLKIALLDEKGLYPKSIRNAVSLENSIIGDCIVATNLVSLDEKAQFEKQGAEKAKEISDSFKIDSQTGHTTFFGKDGTQFKTDGVITCNVHVFSKESLLETDNKIKELRSYMDLQRKTYDDTIKNLTEQRSKDIDLILSAAKASSDVLQDTLSKREVDFYKQKFLTDNPKKNTYYKSLKEVFKEEHKKGEQIKDSSQKA